jgi:CMP-N-acetylneuraminic acid synthetase
LHTVEAALESRRLDAVLVSSEDPEILEVAARPGVTTVERPSELAADDAPMIGTALHALGHAERELGLEPTALVLLQPTSPFRTSLDVDTAIELFEARNADTLASVVPVDQHPSDCVRVVDGRLDWAVARPHANAQRQELADFYYIDGAIYVAQTSFLRARRLFVDERTTLYVQQRSHGLDIDDVYELELARAALAAGIVR